MPTSDGGKGRTSFLLFVARRDRGLSCPGTHAACWASATERRCGRRVDRLRRAQPAGDRHACPHRRRCVRYLRVINPADPAPRCPAQRRRASAAQGQGQAARSPLALWRGARAVQPRPARPSGGKHGRLVHPRRDLRGVRRDLPPARSQAQHRGRGAPKTRVHDEAAVGVRAGPQRPPLPRLVSAFTTRASCASACARWAGDCSSSSRTTPSTCRSRSASER